MRYRMKENLRGNKYYLTNFHRYLVVDSKTGEYPPGFNYRWAAKLYAYLANRIWQLRRAICAY